jgi:sec-independent protein translocase protein TatB
VFGVGFSEVVLVALVALVVVGPQKLPSMLRTVGEWVGRLRRLTIEMRAQTGIDAILREEGIDGVAELRSLLRGEIAAARTRNHQADVESAVHPDESVEYPVEGPDACGAVPDDLLAPPPAPSPS